MNNKKHYIISLVKSVLRIISSVLSIFFIQYPSLCLSILGVGYGIAELIGILEEVIGTDRKEDKIK